MNELARVVEALLFLSSEPVSVERLAHVRTLLRRLGSFSFDDAVKGVDRLTEAVTLFALLELYKAGEAEWDQGEAFGPITVRAGSG